MKITAFRIQNFRSIIDTTWQTLSFDNITALVGQNESGKSSVLDAINAFWTGDIDEDDLRVSGELPVISISYQFKNANELLDIDIPIPDEITSKKNNPHSRINISRKWHRNANSLDSNLELEEIKFKEIFPIIINNEDESTSTIKENDFAFKVYDISPLIIVFSEKDSILPNSINISDLEDNKSKAIGRQVAINWMNIAGLSIDDLKNPSRRQVLQRLETANKKITEKFQEFWSQTIGKTSKIKFDCRLDNHSSLSKFPGESYLEFWVKDESERLYPKQRSQGVIWYLSFFLQLMSMANDNDMESAMVLIDEPGSSLHAKAQTNVLSLFEELKNKIHFLYSTHSPFMIDSKQLHRILAIEREENEYGYHETKIFNAHKLVSANVDTLLPIFTSMGISLHQNMNIPAKNNIILEEISAFYYILSFYKILSKQCDKSFLPAQGVTNIPVLANLFLGWGLEFAVVVDGDSAGRKIYNELKRTLCMDKDELAQKKLYKIDTNGGIENLFHPDDFIHKVAIDINLDHSKSSNSDKIKENAKAIIAAKFKSKIDNDEFKKEDFNEFTINSITSLIESISNLEN